MPEYEYLKIVPISLVIDSVLEPGDPSTDSFAFDFRRKLILGLLQYPQILWVAERWLY